MPLIWLSLSSVVRQLTRIHSRTSLVSHASFSPFLTSTSRASFHSFTVGGFVGSSVGWKARGVRSSSLGGAGFFVATLALGGAEGVGAVSCTAGGGGSCLQPTRSAKQTGASRMSGPYYGLWRSFSAWLPLRVYALLHRGFDLGGRFVGARTTRGEARLAR